ncbi:MAG TPA: right-handed parallel beta-helix repeat-containing protein [Candidatus Baltobacteraceae bacterium]|nr:right-handed parallel beta-helix repeat-containing protein [Candidatus Baltobacteraceae bacterium]
MSQRALTRAELIGGLLATGALAACGGAAPPGARPAPIASPCGSASTSGVAASHPVYDIFSHPVFDRLDKGALAKLFDPSAQLQALIRGYFAQSGQRIQVANAIDSIPSAGIVIQTPGTYTFSRDIRWTPNDAQCSAITILSSDVTLDLAGYTLTASAANKEQQITGIAAGSADDPAITNVTIKNGAVANVPEHGILAANVGGLTISDFTVTGICMQNLCTRLLTPAGIKVSGSSNVTISRCSVTQLNVTTDSCAGIMLLNTDTATVTGCSVSSLVNNDGAVQGFGYIKSTWVTTTGCSAQMLQSHFNGNVKTSGHTVLGFCPIFCQNLGYYDCSASNLNGCCDDCHGMSVFLDGAVLVSGFSAETVTDGVSPSNSGAKATGLEVYGTGVLVTDSTVSAITAINPQDLQATGFSAWGQGNSFVRCTAVNVKVIDNFHTGALGEGFGWAPDPRPVFSTTPATNTTYTDCTAEQCDVGFDTWNHVDSTWTNPTCTDCKTAILAQPQGTMRTVSCDPCSECNPAFNTSLKNQASGNTYPVM